MGKGLLGIYENINSSEVNRAFRGEIFEHSNSLMKSKKQLTLEDIKRKSKDPNLETIDRLKRNIAGGNMDGIKGASLKKQLTVLEHTYKIMHGEKKMLKSSASLFSNIKF